MGQQRTLRNQVTLNGVGLHSGKVTQMTLKPASPNRGIVFIRVDLEDSPQIDANYKNVVNTQMATTLGVGRTTVGTVEHVLAAFQGMGIDNAIVEVDGPEIPVMDGSSIAFCSAIESAGIESQHPPQTFIKLRKRVELKGEGKWAIAEPYSKLEIHGSIEWEHPSIGYQEFIYQEGKTSFRELASARTFGFLRDVEALKKVGLARGGSLDNAVVLDDTRVLNPGGLRFVDEFVRHKVLDALGDFKLSGIPLQGYFRLHRAGHDLHSQLLNKIFSSAENYEVVHASEREAIKLSRLQAAIAARFAASL